MTATGSDYLASLASTATSSVINGVRNGDSFGSIYSHTVVNVFGTAVDGLLAPMVNTSLCAKTTKLNPFQKAVKYFTDDPHEGRFFSGALSDTFESSYKNAKNSVILKTPHRVLISSLSELF